VYPDPRARFADDTNPDRPPMPPDDPGSRWLSPNPQTPGKAGVAWVEGTGYLNLLAEWNTLNRAAATAEAAKDEDAKSPPAPGTTPPGATPAVAPPQNAPSPAAGESTGSAAGAAPAPAAPAAAPSATAVCDPLRSGRPYLI